MDSRAIVNCIDVSDEQRFPAVLTFERHNAATIDLLGSSRVD
jgi:hypothetical protein